MALTLEQQYNLANESTFYDRVALAMSAVAYDVMAEDQSAMTVVDYNGTQEAQARTSLAVGVIGNALETAKRLRWAIVAAGAPGITWTTNAVTTAQGITDNSYVSFIAANWSILAGWRQDDTPDAP